MRGRHRARQVVNFLNLSTPLGLLIAVIGRARVRRGEHGLLYAHGYRVRFPVAGAFTVGNVVLTAQREGYLTGALLRHESRHATQYAYCVGLPLLVLYVLAAGVSLVICGHPASWNVFERLAHLEDGGYQRHPVRWRRRALDRAGRPQSESLPR
ncbi:hypothetical protein Sme01_13330 [Sphaerisporangium melleum]|uniref:DUF4157 domain-containing protein n=1 Tax=Sphaerisporangium melleum TaxID=321316 RepID=A0A917VF15_9ACTN|nr:hypothetical protein [Sphaerisporangium melleum]GGK68152.1 hypothetical protein GCM10007964_08930 [Sphaerisporangium melleum]GII68857.1 hypothetical protein Sme01_13330 [Sphaerisporangium melleum]